MRILLCCLLATAAALPGPAVAQRKFRLGPTASSLSLDEGATSNAYTSIGASVALLTGDDAETGITVSRYGDLSNDACERSLTFFGLDSYYYPIGARGIAPFASTQIGLARVTDGDQTGIIFGPCSTPEPSNEIGLAFGLGLRLGLGQDVAALVEGRFFQVPNSAIQALEARANLSLALGRSRTGDFLEGAVGPSVGVLIPVSGPMKGRGPFLGARFRRDTKKAGTVGLQIDYAPLSITDGCTTNCEPYAILFAPGYETSAHLRWGRLYGGVGFLLAGFPTEGPDRGIAQGAQGGLGTDVYAGARTMVNLNARLLWLQRKTGENVFGVQLGVSVSPKLVHPRAGSNPP